MIELYKFLIEFQPGIDKLYHLFYGSILFIALLAIFKKRSIVLLIVPVLVGVIKEILDVKLGLGNFEYMDIFWTSFPSFFPYVIMLLKNE